MAGRGKKRRRRLRGLVAVAVVFAAATSVALAQIAGGEVSPRGLRRAVIVVSGRVAPEADVREGYGRVFADLGVCVVAAGETGALLIGPDGKEDARETFAMSAPAIADNGEIAAVYSSGGRDVLLMGNAGVLGTVRVDADIRGVTVSGGGLIAVATGAVGRYRGSVMVYRIRGGTVRCVYEWYSGTDYVVGAAVSGDGKSLAAVTLGSAGGRVVLCDLNDTKTRAESRYPRALLDAAYMRDGTLLARTHGGLLSVTGDGVISTLYDCGAYDTVAYDTGDGEFASLYLMNRAGEGKLVTVDTRGRVCESDRGFGKAASLRTRDGHVALLTETGLYVFRDRTLERYASYDGVSAFTDAFPRDATTAVAVGARQLRVES